MKIDRRKFIRGTAVAGLVPTLAKFMLPLSSLSAHAAVPLDLSAHRLPAGDANVNGLAFGIDGWELKRPVELGDPQMPSALNASDASPTEQVWIGVNQAWRANWR